MYPERVSHLSEICVKSTSQQFAGKEETTKESHLHLYATQQPKSKGQREGR